MKRIAVVALCAFAALCSVQAAPSFHDKLDAVLSSNSTHLIKSAQLSPDGRWLVYSFYTSDERRLRGQQKRRETYVVLRSTQGDIERRFAVGEQKQGAGAPKLSPSGRWLAFRRVMASEESASRGSVALVEVATGKVTEYADQNGFSFVGRKDGPEWIVLKGSPTAEGKQAFPVTILRLGAEGIVKLKAANTFVINPPGTRLAWIDERGLHEYEFAVGRKRTLDTGSPYQQLTWSEKGNALAALRGDESSFSLLTVTRLDRKEVKKAVFDPRNWRGFPRAYEISPDMDRQPGRGEKLLNWREDEGGVFFRIRAIGQDNEKTETIPNLVLWHSRDQIPPQSKGLKRRDWQWEPSRYLSFVSIAEGHFVQLADATLGTVQSHRRGRWLLGYDDRPYIDDPRFNQSTPHFKRDYYLVDLRTGRRTLAVKGLITAVENFMTTFGIPRLSPDGTVVLYQGSDGEYYAYEAQTGRRRNLTGKLQRRFHHETVDRARHVGEGWLMSEALQGWTRDSKYALVSDGRDVWALALKGGQSFNLTRNGWKEDIVYERTLLSPAHRAVRLEDQLLGLNVPVHFYARDRKTGSIGLVRWIPASQQLEMLQWEAGNGSYLKAEEASVYVAFYGNASDSQDYYRLDAAGRRVERLTDINPKQRDLYLREPLYLSYPSGNGEISHSVLQLPLDRTAVGPYPTIVDIYEQLRSGPHDSVLGSELPHVTYLEHGYAVLFAHIQPRMREPGKAALQDVRLAVDAAVASGAVDRDRLGLTGHSMGGYETNFIISQTDIFKAAVTLAGTTDLVSYCNSVDGVSRLLGCASDQPFLGSIKWWEELPIYLENSPLFHAQNIHTPLLLIYGDQDPAVPFTQAVELFNTLYYMGNKQVVLLQYAGEDHTSIFNGDTARDMEARRVQFFDHFLKGAPAPEWWSEGISYTQGRPPRVSLDKLR